VGALKGELSATAVNAPMVPPEVNNQIYINCLHDQIYYCIPQRKLA
jgi:hypothetical protein